MVTVYDGYLPIYDGEGADDLTDESLNALDEMLNDYDIDHCFRHPTAAEKREFKEKEKVLELQTILNHLSEDRDTVMLIYLLWDKKVRHDELLHEEIWRLMKRTVGVLPNDGSSEEQKEENRLGEKGSWKREQIDYMEALYEPYIPKYKGHDDDRAVYVNIYDRIVESVKSLPDEPNWYVRCAMNRAIEKDLITLRFVIDKFSRSESNGADDQPEEEEGLHETGNN